MDNIDEQLERATERTIIAAQLHDIEKELKVLIEKYGLGSDDSVPLSGLYLIVSAASRLMALTVTHEPVTSVSLMKDLVFAAHDIHNDVDTALRYALDHLTDDEGLAKTSLGDILGQSLWSADGGK